MKIQKKSLLWGSVLAVIGAGCVPVFVGSLSAPSPAATKPDVVVIEPDLAHQVAIHGDHIHINGRCVSPKELDTAPLWKPEARRYYQMAKNRDQYVLIPLVPGDPSRGMKRVPLGKVAACFADGTPPEIVAAFMQGMIGGEEGQWPDPNDLRNYNLTTRWNGTSGATGGTAGNPASVTWSFAPDGLSIPSGVGEPTANNTLFATLDAQFAAQGGRARWVGLFQSVFDRWSQLTGLDYVRVTNGTNDWDDGAGWTSSRSATRGDIRIAMKPIDGGSGTLAYNFFPGTGSAGNMVLDSQDSWNGSSNNWRFVRNTISHEHGHGQGLFHVCPIANSKLMEPFLSTAFDGPQQDDIRAGHGQYGDPFESNNTAATAFNLGSVSTNATTNFGSTPADITFPTAPIPANSSIMSIHPNDANDWYTISVPGSANFTFTATPVGTSYDDSTQANNGSCNSGNVLDALRQARLTVQVTSADGATVFGSGTAAALGNNAVATGSLPAAGSYRLFVGRTGTHTNNKVQLYRLTLVTTPGAGGNQPPNLAPLNSVSIPENVNHTFTASATDPDAGQTITYSLSGAPAGATIGASNGVFNWTPTEAQGPGTYTFSVVATDNGSPTLSDTESITLTVTETNSPPTITNAQNLNVNEGQLLTYDLNATDTDDPAQSIGWTVTGAPSGLAIQATTGILAWTPTEAQGPGTYNVTVRATDTGSPSQFDQEVITITVNEVNAAPSLAAIGNQNVNEGSNLTFTAVGSDTDTPAQTLTYSLVGAPSGATINPTSGVFNWTPTEAQGPNNYTFTVRVTDDGPGNLTADRSVTVTVNEVNSAPSLAAIGNQIVNEGSNLTFTAVGSDSDVPAQTLTYSLVGAPGGATINPTSGVFNWTPTEAQGQNNYTFTVRVTDSGAGNLTADRSVNVTVNEVNQAPVLAAIGTQNVSDSTSLVTINASATDADLPANTLTFSLSGQPSGMTINPSSGVISWSPAIADRVGSYTFTVSVSDGGSPILSDSESVTLNFVATSKTVGGTINLLDYIGSAYLGQQVDVEIRNVGSTTPIAGQAFTVTVNPDGSYGFTTPNPLPNGTYDIAFKGSHWLRKVVGSVTLAPGVTNSVSTSLINGDVDGDNSVTIFDYIELSDKFDLNLGDPGFNENADLDGDGAITIFDYIVLSDTFDQFGDN